MMNRKKKLRIAQISLLVLGSLILIFTYSERTVSKKRKNNSRNYTRKN